MFKWDSPYRTPNQTTTLLLRSCKTLRHLLQIHAHLTVVGSSFAEPLSTLLLTSYYSSFNDPTSAQTILHSIHNPTAFSWNSMIRAHTTAHRPDDALGSYPQMLRRAVRPDNYTFTFLAKACAEIPHLGTGASVHGQAVRRGFAASDVYVGTALLDMYCKLGAAGSARHVFDEMPQRDVVSWNAMVDGLALAGDATGALALFRRMQAVGVEPNSVTLLNLFPVVCEAGDGTAELHAFAMRRWMGSSVCNGLIDAYSKCGEIGVARRVFDGMLGLRDAVSWGAMISGYVCNGCFHEALELFDELKLTDADANAVSVVGGIVAATELEDLGRGAAVHDYAVQKGIDEDIQVVTTLLTLYARCGNMEKARELFRGIHEKDTVAWCAMISAFSQHGHAREALTTILEMQEAGIRPNRASLVSILPACVEILDINLGKSVHSYMIKFGIGLDREVGTALVAMYAKCGQSRVASFLFDRLPQQDIVAWNALISGYAQSADAINAIRVFHKLWSLGVQLDRGTIIGVLPACADLRALNQGMAFHAIIVKGGFKNDSLVKNALIDVYAKCGNVQFALFLFNKYDCFEDIISWNTIIAGFVQNGYAKEAMNFFHQLRNKGFKANLATLVSILPGAAQLGALKEGMTLHSYAVRVGFESYLSVRNSLIDMYSKCGRPSDARELFDHLICRDTVSWNTMITGYAINGLGQDALTLFSQMQESRMQLDKVSFLGILSACRHGGLIEEGKKIFESMRSKYHLEPKLEHYACMVDLLGRAGHLHEAWYLIQEMPMQPDASVWGAFLDACRVHCDLQMGKMALNHLVGLESMNAGPYVVMSNICAELGKWVEASNLRKSVRNVGLNKVSGCSWL